MSTPFSSSFSSSFLQSNHQSILISLLFTLFSIQEGGRSKSHRYWPKLGSKHNSATHGKFKVTTKFRTDSGCYATTGLKVKHLLSGQERTVWHLQYTDWPEQGCPEYVVGFLCEWDCVMIITIINLRECQDVTGSDETLTVMVTSVQISK